MNDLLGLGKLSQNSLDIIKLVYPDLAQPAVKKVGLALETVMELANTILLPIKLANENSRVYFQKHMDTYKEKLNKYSEDEIGVVPPEIGLNILDELLKVTNEDLANLFTNLLVNASLVEGSRHAHPSFINVIKSLGFDEAKVINYLSKNPDGIIYIRYERVSHSTGSSIPLSLKINNLYKLVPLDFIENKEFYTNNLMNLGIIENVNTFQTSRENEYQELANELKELESDYEKLIEEINQKENPKGNSQYLLVNRGRYRLSRYGDEFVKSVILDNTI
jgi:hypothetical protein